MLRQRDQKEQLVLLNHLGGMDSDIDPVILHLCHRADQRIAHFIIKLRFLRLIVIAAVEEAVQPPMHIGDRHHILPGLIVDPHIRHHHAGVHDSAGKEHGIQLLGSQL